MMETRGPYFQRFLKKKLVLPEGIELSTSPLPRECSTTELRQLKALARKNRTRTKGRGGKAPASGGRTLPQGLTGGKPESQAPTGKGIACHAGGFLCPFAGTTGADGR
jgi:hypothetical protein